MVFLPAWFVGHLFVLFRVAFGCGLWMFAFVVWGCCGIVVCPSEFFFYGPAAVGGVVYVLDGFVCVIPG